MGRMLAWCGKSGKRLGAQPLHVPGSKRRKKVGAGKKRGKKTYYPEFSHKQTQTYILLQIINVKKNIFKRSDTNLSRKSRQPMPSLSALTWGAAVHVH